MVIVWAANGFVQSMGWAPGGRLISVWWPRERRGLAFGLYMLAAGSATVLVWCTSYLVLGMFDPDDPSRWRWLFRIPLVALAASGVCMRYFVLAREILQRVPVSQRSAAIGFIPCWFSPRFVSVDDLCVTEEATFIDFGRRQLANFGDDQKILDLPI